MTYEQPRPWVTDPMRTSSPVSRMPSATKANGSRARRTSSSPKPRPREARGDAAGLRHHPEGAAAAGTRGPASEDGQPVTAAAVRAFLDAADDLLLAGATTSAARSPAARAAICSSRTPCAAGCARSSAYAAAAAVGG